MRKQDIELRVINILERVLKNQPIEDDTVELKAEWPRDHQRAARRIAGHANSARGESILWLIGVDEKGEVVGADFEELPTWFARVRSRFEGLLAPDLISLAVPFEDKTVVALYFETDRAPYVIKTGDATGTVTHEAPWREANSTRSARRADLLKMLYPIQRSPKVEVLDGSISLFRSLAAPLGGEGLQWTLTLKLYFTTHALDTVVFPFHRCQVALRHEGAADDAYFDNLRMTPPTTYHAREFKEKNQSLTVSATEHEVLVNTAGMVILSGEILVAGPAPRVPPRRLSVKAHLMPHHVEIPMVFEAVFRIEEAIGVDEDRPRLVARWQCHLETPAEGEPHA
jgi:hypothetical protein